MTLICDPDFLNESKCMYTICGKEMEGTVLSPSETVMVSIWATDVVSLLVSEEVSSPDSAVITVTVSPLAGKRVEKAGTKSSGRGNGMFPGMI